MIHHKGLNKNQWFGKSVSFQMANIGSEVSRMIKWRNKKPEYSELAFERALELIDLTVQDPKNKIRLKEILRVRELLVALRTGSKEYQVDENWMNYFNSFAVVR